MDYYIQILISTFGDISTKYSPTFKELKNKILIILYITEECNSK